MNKRVVLVTDPMCSWCWGMASEFEQARHVLADEFSFDLILGGINTHGSQAIGDYGRRFLMRLWREVQETTGQEFGYELPDRYIHNSIAPCLALEAVRVHTGDVPFELLHELQRRFFMLGENITDLGLLGEMVMDYGIDDFSRVQLDPGLRERLKFQFESAISFGTNAMPSLLGEGDDKLQLIAGGYVDAPMMAKLLSDRY